ncbi:response regulator receiver modulated GAF sensor protein [[Leptolyngbya] sp. PCC 7376]|uniref:response regulator n=1 Tax=[Leptolyngbya] sp. PCC 7376 TaxID=111781 RepID=UPI00029EF9CA|nr:response regulator [[Leptolyngbya] sp. PCC 7376]AFY40193.1 response regulator receiver modulated GAF sensor protein [[Leptolyngbya] sp. PCC 7376]
MTIPEFTHITEQMKAVTRRQKAKLLVVDDEPDNLDLLYRTFRRDFHVLRASNGIEALQVLEEEGEVAVIISDQRMPKMKGTEFLSRTVPEFPNTMRIILTGFTDVEDLVEAINAGQVYRYITKPWDPAELQDVVAVAAETYATANNRIAELERSQNQTQLLGKLLTIFASDTPLEETLNQATAAIMPALGADACYLKITKSGDCEDAIGESGSLNTAIAIPENDPLIAKVKESLALQLWLNSRKTPPPEDISYYTENAIKQHLLLPLTYRQEILALLSLQWLDVCTLRESDLNLLYLASQQIAFALISQKSC